MLVLAFRTTRTFAGHYRLASVGRSRIKNTVVNCRQTNPSMQEASLSNTDSPVSKTIDEKDGIIIPTWLGGGLHEVASNYSRIFVAADVIHNGDRAFEWAVDCLEELVRLGCEVVILQPTSSTRDNVYGELERFGLFHEQHFLDAIPVYQNPLYEQQDPDSNSWMAAFSELASDNMLSNPTSSRRALVACASRNALLGATSVGLDIALVCTGALSADFGLSPAPQIDVPADGGKFNEIDDDCWNFVLAGIPPPRYACACFSFSPSFFFQFFAARAGNARKAFALRRLMQKTLE